MQRLSTRAVSRTAARHLARSAAFEPRAVEIEDAAAAAVDPHHRGVVAAERVAKGARAGALLLDERDFAGAHRVAVAHTAYFERSLWLCRWAGPRRASQANSSPATELRPTRCECEEPCILRELANELRSSKVAACAHSHRQQLAYAIPRWWRPSTPPSRTAATASGSGITLGTGKSRQTMPRSPCAWANCLL